MNRQSGQVTVEYVLIMVVMVSLFLFLRKNLFQEGEFLSNMIGGPWDRMAGVIESGRFDRAEKARAFHPGNGDRHQSLRGVQE